MPLAQRKGINATVAQYVFNAGQNWSRAQDLPQPPAREGVCLAGAGSKGLDPRHKILRVPQIYHESTTCVYDVNAHGMGYQINVHANCVCNELKALTNRHLVDRTYIAFDKTLWRDIAKETLRFYPQGLSPIRYEEVLAAYRGNKKRMYYKAMLDLKTNGLQPHHWLVKMFVKPDRYPVGDIDSKDPRAIQYRSPHFNISMAVYVKPIEETLYPSLTYGVVSGTRVIAKGMNNVERAELFFSKLDSFKNPRFVLLDHSRFDSTVNVEHLQATHRKYLRCIGSRYFSWLLSKQLKNTGYSKNGIKYKTQGTRMSGDADTALGNSLINADCLYGFLTRSGVEKYDFILDGDDSVVIIEADDVSRLDYTLFERLGFDTKMEVVNEIDEVEFCQSKIVLATPVTWVRKPERALSHSAVCRKRYTPLTYQRWLAAVGECEWATNRGVPVLQSYGLQLAGLAKPILDEELRYRWGLGDHSGPVAVTADARDSFFLAFGVHHDIQVLLEKHDYTANAFCSKIFGKDEQFRVARVARRIRALSQLTPEFSGCCWWSSSQTRAHRPGQCSH